MSIFFVHTNNWIVEMIDMFIVKRKKSITVLSAKSDSDVMFCLQSYQRLRIDRSLVY